MFCHKCGNKSLENAKFCQKCGTKLIKSEGISQNKIQSENIELQISEKNIAFETQTRSNNFETISGNKRTETIVTNERATTNGSVKYEKSEKSVIDNRSNISQNKYFVNGFNEDSGNIQSNITFCPDLYGSSVRYKNKIDSHNGFDTIICPNCGSKNNSFFSNTQKAGFSAGDACCGYILLGPIGVLCGAFGANSTTTTEYWVCNSCGNKFENRVSETTNAVLKNEADLLSCVPDETIDNIEKIHTESVRQMQTINDKRKKMFIEEYKTKTPLKIFAIIILSIILISIVLSVIFGIEFGTFYVILTIIIAVVLLCVLLLIVRSMLEKKYASEEYNQLIRDSKEANKINSRIEEIKKAKQHLSKLKII